MKIIIVYRIIKMSAQDVNYIYVIAECISTDADIDDTEGYNLNRTFDGI